MLTKHALPAKETQYIFPPRSQDAIPFTETGILAAMGWIAQLKYNDSRCLIKYKSDGTIELWNRHGERFRNYTAPTWLLEQLDSLRTKLNIKPGHFTILDGGLLDQKHISIKDTIVIWDILVHNNTQLLNSTYNDRYQHLHQTLTGGHAHTTTWTYTNPQKPTIHAPIDFGHKITDNILMPRNYEGNRSTTPDNDGNPPGDAWAMIWKEMIETANAPYTTSTDCKPVLEGLVFKDPNGRLEMGFKEKNNSKWMIRSRVNTGRHRF